MLVFGEATDVVKATEVQSVVGAVVRVAGRYIPPALRPAFLAELEEATAGLATVVAEVEA